MIKSFNNKTDKVGDDLKESIQGGSKIDVAAGIFSIYGYESLKKVLKKIDHLRFIFTDPTFVELDKSKREQRQFQINSNLRKKAISGSDFEINLKNELKGKAIAEECKKWIEQKVTFKTNAGKRYIQPHLSLKNKENNFVYNGIHSVCKKVIEKEIHEGVIFVLKNINSRINIDNTNQLHPFYLVYIQENGEILSNHLNVKTTLDILRVISKGNDQPIREVFERFNHETDDGKKMENYSALLGCSIESILNVKDESDVDSLFTTGGTTALVNSIRGLEDFELLAFVVVK